MTLTNIEIEHAQCAVHSGNCIILLVGVVDRHYQSRSVAFKVLIKRKDSKLFAIFDITAVETR